MRKALKIWLIVMILAVPFSTKAQLGKVLISANPVYHFSHGGILDKFKSGPGVYLRIHSISTNFYLESGYVWFQSKEAIHNTTSNSADYTMSYSNYSAIPITLGYKIELNNNEKQLFQAGLYGGYWYSFCDYHFQDELINEKGVMGSNKVHFGGSISYNRRIGKVNYGAEVRYTALIPVKGFQDLNYAGMFISGLHIGYIF